MTSEASRSGCAQAELVGAFAIDALPENEIPAIEAHIAICAACRADYDSLRVVAGTFGAWPADELQPSLTLWDRLAQRIPKQDGTRLPSDAAPHFEVPEWEEVAPGISCKLLATDGVRHRVSMLVRLAPGTEYPPHTHAGVEELHLLDGELFIDDRKLLPGDYNRAEPGTSDRRVWSETGCTCVLMTSIDDRLG
jgi:anti-sigma factor ChrR (cupin superfamily)